MQEFEGSLAGWVSKDGELFTTQSGIEIGNLSVFVKVKGFGHSASTITKLKKGQNVMVKGKFKENKWKDKRTGEDKISIECLATEIIEVTDREPITQVLTFNQPPEFHTTGLAARVEDIDPNDIPF